MNRRALTEEIKQYAKEQGADLVGIGSMDRFEGAPKNSDPRYIMPEAKSIIGLGFRIHRGTLRGIEEGTHFGSYPSLCYANINDVHAPVVLRQVGSMIEDIGYETFLFGNSIVRYSTNGGRPVRDGYPEPDVFMHFRIAAFICGMGEIGWSKVFLTPEFGPRQRFAFILTDLELEPDPLYDGPPLCDRCKRCVAHCPVDAIPKDESVKVTVAGRELEWALIDLKRCGLGWQAANAELNPFADKETTEYIRKVMADGRDRVQRDKEIWEPVAELKKIFPYTKSGWHFFRHPGAICGGRGCVRSCMIHLEEKGCLKNRFKDKFRRRKEWKMEPLDTGTKLESKTAY